MGQCKSSDSSVVSKYAINAAVNEAPSVRVGTRIHRGPVFDVAFGSDGARILAAGDDNEAVQLDTAQDRILDCWKGHSSCINRIAYAASTDTVYTASRDLSIRSWRPGQSAAVGSLLGHELSIHGLCVNEAGSQVCSGSRDCSIRLWDAASCREIGSRSIDRNMVTSLRWVPGEAAVLQTSEDLELRLWDTRAMLPAQTFPKDQYFALCGDVAPDGRSFLTGNNGFDGNGCEVRLWDRRMCRVLSTARGHSHAVRGCAFLGPSRAVTVSKDQSLRLWDFTEPASPANIATSSMPDSMALTSVAVSKEGEPRLVAGCEAGFIGVFDQALSLQFRTASR